MPVKDNNLSGVIRVFVILLAVVTLIAAVFQFVTYYGSSAKRIDSFGSNNVSELLSQIQKAYADKVITNFNMLKAIDEYFAEKSIDENFYFSAEREYVKNRQIELGAEAVVFIDSSGNYI